MRLSEARHSRMLKSSACVNLLSKTLSPSTVSSLLLTKDGALIAFAGGSEQAAKMSATRAASALSQHQSADGVLIERDSLLLYVEACTARIAVCVVAVDGTPQGMIRLKGRSLVKALRDELARLE